MLMKHFALSALRNSHATLFARDLPERVAIYFHELDAPYKGAFKESLGYFLDRGYRTVCASEFTNPSLSGKLLFVSFDDNYESWVDAADALDDLGATATFYINSGFMRDKAHPAEIADFFRRIDYHGPGSTLSTDELRDIHARGHRIGCHTHRHRVLAELPRTRWASEIDTSKRVLEDWLGAPVTDFSFPFGMRRHFSEPLRRYCATAGFSTVATGISGMQHLGHNDPLELHRTGWKFHLPLEENILNLRIDGSLYARVTGRSVIG